MPCGWDADFVKYLAEDLRSLVTTAPIILVFSLFIAVVLNTKVWGRTAFRALFFLPVIACTGLLSMMDSENMVMSVMNSGDCPIRTAPCWARSATRR